MGQSRNGLLSSDGIAAMMRKWTANNKEVPGISFNYYRTYDIYKYPNYTLYRMTDINFEEVIEI
jgi:hypothetical protein